MSVLIDSHALDVYTSRSKVGVGSAVVVMVLVQIQSHEDEWQS